VVVTKHLPGDRWLKILTSADCRVEVSQHEDVILSNQLVKDLIGKQCDGVIGQLTEVRMATRSCTTGVCRCIPQGMQRHAGLCLCCQSASAPPSTEDLCSMPRYFLFSGSLQMLLLRRCRHGRLAPDLLRFMHACHLSYRCQWRSPSHETPAGNASTCGRPESCGGLQQGLARRTGETSCLEP